MNAAFARRSAIIFFSTSIGLSSGCRDAQPTVSTMPEDSIDNPTDTPRQVERVGGDLAAQVVQSAEGYRFKDMLIDTPLPNGYPPPTPPGALEIKRYPIARRAEIRGGVNSDIGMYAAFWPLFQHIKKRDIAMTSPVEMRYAPGTIANEGGTPRNWSMSFLYRDPSQGPEGTDNNITILDAAPMVVLAIGSRGGYSWNRTEMLIDKLNAWLAAHPAWVVDGDPRAMHYNGPDRPDADKWLEVQLPIRRSEVRSGQQS